jgi:hypothetical protein
MDFPVWYIEGSAIHRAAGSLRGLVINNYDTNKESLSRYGRHIGFEARIEVWSGEDAGWELMSRVPTKDLVKAIEWVEKQLGKV